VALVGEDLSDVAVGEGHIGRAAGPFAALPRPAIELDRIVPAAVEVGEHAQVVEHRGLALHVAQLLVDLQGTPGVRGFRPPARFHERPVQRV
jgi:hypothetical protein